MAMAALILTPRLVSFLLLTVFFPLLDFRFMAIHSAPGFFSPPYFLISLTFGLWQLRNLLCAGFLASLFSPLLDLRFMVIHSAPGFFSPPYFLLSLTFGLW
jgi:hypothetical protein